MKVSIYFSTIYNIIIIGIKTKIFNYIFYCQSCDIIFYVFSFKGFVEILI